MKLRKTKGFTLAELLIVVAIIAVLVAVAIPVFSSQLQNARIRTSQANIRSAYAQATAKIIQEEGVHYETGLKWVSVKDVTLPSTGDEFTDHIDDIFENLPFTYDEDDSSSVEDENGNYLMFRYSDDGSIVLRINDVYD